MKDLEIIVPVKHEANLWFSRGRKFFLVFILFFYFLFIPGALGKAGAAGCKNPRPETPPVLLSAVPKDRSVVLTWKEATDPLTHYWVAYGKSATEIEYGNPNVGLKGTTTYTVRNLANGVKYYFKVRGENGCKAGKFSNKLSAIPGYAPAVKSASHPNLSIYRAVEGISASATQASELNEEKAPSPDLQAIANDRLTNCSECSGLRLLAVEVLFLAFYLFLAGRFLFLKRIYAVIIPFSIYLFFSKINGTCPNNNYNFFCKYFLQLNIILFMATIILYKNKYINLKFNFIQRLFKKIKHKL